MKKPAKSLRASMWCSRLALMWDARSYALGRYQQGGMKAGTESTPWPGGGRSTVRIVDRRRQIFIWALLGIAFGILSLAAADLSPTCRALARQFADSPDALNADALIHFQTCIHTELKRRGMDAADTQSQQTPRPPSKGFIGPGGITIPFR